MNIIFFGTTEFSKNILKTIIGEGFKVSLVVTVKEKPRGRGRRVSLNPVQEYALEKGLEVFSENPNKNLEYIKSFKADIFVTCAYGIILSEDLLNLVDLPINIHASLLPKYRGAAPIERSIMAGDKITGITIMKMIFKMDAGDILLQEKIEISDKNFLEVENELNDLASKMIVDYLKNPHTEGIKQDESLVTFADKISKTDYDLVLEKDANTLINYERALGYLRFFLNGVSYKVFSSYKSPLKGEKGVILKIDDEIVIGVDNDSIGFKYIQKEGKKKMSVKDFMNGQKQEDFLKKRIDSEL